MKTSDTLYLLGLLNAIAGVLTRDTMRGALIVIAVVLLCTALLMQKLEKTGGSNE